MVFVEFVAFFAFTLLFGYLLPVGQFYYWYHVRKDPRKEQQRIQQRRPANGQVRHEILSSLSTIVIFAILATALFQLYLAGLTAVYCRLSDYPLWYVPISFLFCLVIHDTFFYWTHRVMHWPRIQVRAPGTSSLGYSDAVGNLCFPAARIHFAIRTGRLDRDLCATASFNAACVSFLRHGYQYRRTHRLRDDSRERGQQLVLQRAKHRLPSRCPP